MCYIEKIVSSHSIDNFCSIQNLLREKLLFTQILLEKIQFIFVFEVAKCCSQIVFEERICVLKSKTRVC